VAALASLAALALLLGVDAFGHTDDGCVIETHCVACRWHQGATVEPTAASPSACAGVADIGPALLPSPPAAASGAPRTAPSRGPPAA